MPGDQKAVNIGGIVLHVGAQDFVDERGDWLKVEFDIGERCGGPAVIGGIGLSVRKRRAARRARKQPRGIAGFTAGECQRRMRIQSGKGETVGLRVIHGQTMLEGKLVKASPADLKDSEAKLRQYLEKDA